MVHSKLRRILSLLEDNMKFKNFDGKEYTVNYVKPPNRFSADGLCDNPTVYEYPTISIDPKLGKKRMLNVLIEEVFHAHMFDMPEWKARKFSANLGKLIYNKFIKK